jgi:hypothetical protein
MNPSIFAQSGSKSILGFVVYNELFSLTKGKQKWEPKVPI